MSPIRIELVMQGIVNQYIVLYHIILAQAELASVFVSRAHLLSYQSPRLAFNSFES